MSNLQITNQPMVRTNSGATTATQRAVTNYNGARSFNPQGQSQQQLMQLITQLLAQLQGFNTGVQTNNGYQGNQGANQWNNNTSQGNQGGNQWNNNGYRGNQGANRWNNNGYQGNQGGNQWQWNNNTYPAPTPMPNPQPMPTPMPVTPRPSPMPNPQPVPTPMPVTPRPSPMPNPQPMPTPMPVTPRPSPMPNPQPMPTPMPVTPRPSPMPNPQPMPTPMPVTPMPTPTTVTPQPAPIPAPAPNVGFQNNGGFDGNFATYNGKQTHSAANLTAIINKFSADAAMGKGTGTGLDKIVNTILADKGLNNQISAQQIRGGAYAANGLNTLIAKVAKEIGADADGVFTENEIQMIGNIISTNYNDIFLALHGDDEGGEETGFHLVQNDGGTLNIGGGAGAAINTVFDGIYHIGFDVKNTRFTNEDGNANATVKNVTEWLNNIYFDASTTSKLVPGITNA